MEAHHVNGPGGLGTVTFQHVTVPTRRLQPTVTGDEVKFEVPGHIARIKRQPVNPRPSALVGTVGWDNLVRPRCPPWQSVKQVYGMGYYWGWMGWDGMGQPWILSGLSCLEGERIRFIWEAVEGSDPVANRQRKIGQSGAVPTAVDAKGPDSTAGEGFGRPEDSDQISLMDTKRTCAGLQGGTGASSITDADKM